MTVGLISKVFINQVRNHRRHFIYIGRTFRLLGWGQTPNRSKIFVVNLGIFFCDFRNINALLFGAFDNLIIHVCNIARIDNMLFAVNMAQYTEQHIGDHRSSRIADMSVAIDRRATIIHRHASRVLRFENLFFARE